MSSDSDWNRFVVDDSTSCDDFTVAFNPDKFEDLELVEGIFVIIRNKSQYVLASIAKSQDECDESSVQMNKIMRYNLNVNPKDLVLISWKQAQNVQLCTQVTILPYKDSIEKFGNDFNFSEVLKNFFNKNRKDILTPLHLNKTFEVSDPTYTLSDFKFKVVDMKPSQYTYINDKTKILTDGDPIDNDDKLDEIGYRSIGGCSQQLHLIRELIELPLRYPKYFTSLGIIPPHGILLYGPPGCGKSLIAHALANETGATFFVINGPKFLGANQGKEADTLKEVFDEAQKSAPSIIFIDELDSIAPNRDKNAAEKKNVIELMILLDGLTPGVVVLGATNRPNTIDPSLRRYGRFDHEIEIGLPDENGRSEIFKIHTAKMHLDNEDEVIKELSQSTQGFVGADIASLCTDAVLNCIRENNGPVENQDGSVDPNSLKNMKVTMKHFDEALKTSKGPSSLRESFIEVPNVSWDDIGGLKDVKLELRKTVEYPLNYPELFRMFSLEPSRGILLYGPPGCGKTLIAKAIARQCKANFLSVKGPELLSMWVGESEANVRNIFQKARQASPCIIFFDEIDSIASVRGHSNDSGTADRIINQLLTELDGIESRKSVFVIGATNRPDMIDPAIIRPGRLDQLINIPIPDADTRRAILERKKHLYDSSVNIEDIVSNTRNFSGADIAEVISKAIRFSIDEIIKVYHKDENRPAPTLDKDFPNYKVKMEHFTAAVNSTRASIQNKEEYERQRRIYGSGIAQAPPPSKIPSNNKPNNNNNNNKNDNNNNSTNSPFDDME